MMLINRFLIIQKQLDSNYTVKNSKLHSNSRSKVHEGILRLGAQSVTLLSTLRDPTQLRRRQCGTRQQHPFFVDHCCLL